MAPETRRRKELQNADGGEFAGAPKDDLPVWQRRTRSDKKRKTNAPTRDLGTAAAAAHSDSDTEEEISETSKPATKTATKSSSFRGVTKHRVTARYEAHLWDKDSYNDKQRKKGRQVYLGAYDDEVSAAQAYDLAALKYWGLGTIINFELENYTRQINEMANMPRMEFLAELRRKSSGFSRGASQYRGVARHHHNDRWEARIGRVEGNKYLYLGTFGTQEEAAEAYDRAAIKYRGANAITNFGRSRYEETSIDASARKEPTNNTCKNSFKKSEMSKPAEDGRLPSAPQTMENMIQSIYGGKNVPATSDQMNLSRDAVPVETPGNSHPHESQPLEDTGKPTHTTGNLQVEHDPSNLMRPENDFQHLGTFVPDHEMNDLMTNIPFSEIEDFLDTYQ